LTARLTGQAGRHYGGSPIEARSKDGLSDPPIQCGMVLSVGAVWHLDVGSSHPGAEEGPKGWSVRPLKRYVSWVQNVVKQFGLYPEYALDS
jgi:hypothetical protein